MITGPCLTKVILPVCLPPREICDNGKDDDGDGKVDKEDPDCREICDNGKDDDGDGKTDLEDIDCAIV